MCIYIYIYIIIYPWLPWCNDRPIPSTVVEWEAQNWSYGSRLYVAGHMIVITKPVVIHNAHGCCSRSLRQGLKNQMPNCRILRFQLSSSLVLKGWRRYDYIRWIGVELTVTHLYSNQCEALPEPGVHRVKFGHISESRLTNPMSKVRSRQCPAVPNVPFSSHLFGQFKKKRGGEHHQWGL